MPFPNRAELSGRQKILSADRRKTEANSSRMMQCLANAVRTAAEADKPFPTDQLPQEPRGACQLLSLSNASFRWPFSLVRAHPPADVTAFSVRYVAIAGVQ